MYLQSNVMRKFSMTLIYWAKAQRDKVHEISSTVSTVKTNKYFFLNIQQLSQKHTDKTKRA